MSELHQNREFMMFGNCKDDAMNRSEHIWLIILANLQSPPN